MTVSHDNQQDIVNPVIEFQNVSKSYGTVQALVDVNLKIETGAFFSLLGPSGCGKSTLLRMLAGLETPDSGRILIAGQDSRTIPPYKRSVNMMFQSYALFPHMTIYDNIAFGLKQEGHPKSIIKERVNAILKMVQLEGMDGRKPHQLSGGQRQRVALARCLVKQPKVVLLDEPLAALDKKLRERTQFELIRIQQTVGITFVMVTHDQEEAMTMSTTMAVMNKGRILQTSTPHDIYEYPIDRFVADFIGRANIFEGVAVNSYDLEIEGFDGSIKLHQPLNIGQSGTLLIRPEKIVIDSKKPDNAAHNVLHGRIKQIAYYGDISSYQVEIKSGRLIEVTSTNFRHLAEPFERGADVYLSWNPVNAMVLI